MRRISIFIAMLFMAAGFSLQAQTGPWTNADWPSTIVTTNTVSYGIFDTSGGFAGFPSTPTSGTWSQTLSLDNCCDSTVVDFVADGFDGKQMNSSYINIADSQAAIWGLTNQIDILLQVYGDDSLYATNGKGKELDMHIGTLTPGVQTTITNNVIPPGAKNFHWNWILLTMTNPVSPSAWNTNLPLQNYMGFIPRNTDGTVAANQGQNSGQNGGTINFQNTTVGLGTIGIRAAAWGPVGSFGTSNQINGIFAAPPPCPPEPVNNNLAFVDVNQGLTNNLVILNDGAQTVTNGIGGPANDLRNIVSPSFLYLNTAILSNYLGFACNPNKVMKVGVEFYEDPAQYGLSFGPDIYSSDTNGTGDKTFTGTGTQLLYTNRGSGTWVKVAFWIPSGNLSGPDVNTYNYPGTNYTGVCRFGFSGGFIPQIDRIEMGVVRTAGPLTGVDPIPDYWINPIICYPTNGIAFTNANGQAGTNGIIPGYHHEAEIILGVWTNGLSIAGTADPFGTNGSPDQRYMIEYWGSTNKDGTPNDVRYSIRPSHGDLNYQFVVNNNFWGPRFQDNLFLACTITYYDDPALYNVVASDGTSNSASFGPQAIAFDTGGVSAIHNPAHPRTFITGTGKWLDTYQECPQTSLVGVNAGRSPIRFESVRANQVDATATNSGNIHISRVRYDVIRPCGPYLGVDMFQPLYVKPDGNGNLNVTYHGTATLETAPAVAGPYTTLLSTSNNTMNTGSTPVPAPGSAKYFRLQYPPETYAEMHWSNGYFTNYVQVFTNTNGFVGPVSRIITTNTPVTYTTNIVNGTNMIVTNAGNYTTNFVNGPSNAFFFSTGSLNVTTN
jgi:hypothetical protein